MFVPVGLLVVSSAGWLSMVSVAVHDPGFSVERDYYKKASNYDQELDQRAHNAALGWRVRLVGARRSADGTAQWTIQVVDARGNPLDQLAITAEAFAVARGGDLRISTLSQLGEGRYQLNVARARLGLWEVRIRADQGNSTFTDVLRVDLALGEEPPS
jgi:nitrogen fixation protein FixH